MTREQLEYAIRAACDVADDTEVYVFGSQAILGQFPDAPSALRQSLEADIAPKNRTEAVDVIDGALGELSQFHQSYGFYVHGIPIESATLPAGWEKRVVSICNANTRNNVGWCVEAHDLSASKLAAFRDKDRDFVRILLQHQMVDDTLLRERILNLPVDGDRRATVLNWLEHTMRLLHRS